jgi:hypothetical protein
VKSGTSGDASYSVSIYDAAGNYEYKTINGTTTGSWVAFSDTFDNPSDNDAIRIYLVKNNVTAGTMLFDTISIKQIAPVAKANSFTMYSDDASSGHAVPHFMTEADGIITLDQRVDTESSPGFYSLTTHFTNSETNGGFDSDASGWTGIRGTLASVAGGVDGNCLQLTETGGNINSAAMQGVAVIPGATYSFSAWVKSGSAGNKTYEIVVYDEIYPANKVLFLTGTSSGSWVNRTGTFLAPVGFSNVNVYLIKDGTDAGTMLFDSVSVIQTIPDNPPADSCQQYSADAGAVAGQAGPHFRTEGGGIFGMRSDTGTTLQYVYQKDDLADDGTVTLPDATSGMVLVSCNGEAGMWLVQADGTVTKISGSTNTAAADTDANLCVYDSGTGATVKNRLGATGEIRIVYYYN